MILKEEKDTDQFPYRRYAIWAFQELIEIGKTRWSIPHRLSTSIVSEITKARWYTAITDDEILEVLDKLKMVFGENLFEGLMK